MDHIWHLASLCLPDGKTGFCRRHSCELVSAVSTSRGLVRSASILQFYYHNSLKLYYTGIKTVCIVCIYSSTFSIVSKQWAYC